MSKRPLSDALQGALAQPNEGIPPQTNADAIVAVWATKVREGDPRWLRLLLDTLPRAEAEELARRVADRLVAEGPSGPPAAL